MIFPIFVFPIYCVTIIIVTNCYYDPWQLPFFGLGLEGSAGLLTSGDGNGEAKQKSQQASSFWVYQNKISTIFFRKLTIVLHVLPKKNENDWVPCEPWSILTIWLMVIPSIIRILIVVINHEY